MSEFSFRRFLLFQGTIFAKNLTIDLTDFPELLPEGEFIAKVLYFSRKTSKSKLIHLATSRLYFNIVAKGIYSFWQSSDYIINAKKCFRFEIKNDSQTLTQFSR